MQISFRQGMIRRSTVLTAPNFLQKTTLSGTSIDLIASTQPTVVTFAHYTANYLLEEIRDVSPAWGAGTVPGSDVYNDVLVAMGQTQYLYWDLDFRTGNVGRGWTLLPPIIGGAQPTSPQNDQHWFDTVNMVMKVFRKPSPSSPGKWLDKIRCFAAIYNSSAIIVPYALGSQVGVAGNFNAGHILIGANNRPLRSGDDHGTFFTTETEAAIANTGGQNVKFDATVMYSMATEPMSKFSCVSFLPQRTMQLASSNSITKFVSGIIVEDLDANELGQVISNGVVRNEQWAAERLGGDSGRVPLLVPGDEADIWLLANNVNAPVFCDATGQLTLGPPVVGTVQQVGYVLDVDAIYFNLFPPVRL